jgi:hypothetical protein
VSPLSVERIPKQIVAQLSRLYTRSTLFPHGLRTLVIMEGEASFVEGTAEAFRLARLTRSLVFIAPLPHAGSQLEPLEPRNLIGSRAVLLRVRQSGPRPAGGP